MSRGARKSELLVSTMVTTMNRDFASLMDIWDELGIPEEKRMVRIEVVKHSIEDLLTRMVEEEQDLKERILESIQNSKKEIKILLSELSFDDFTLDDNLTVLQAEKDLRVRLDSLRAEKRERLEELKQLQQEDQDLCTELFMTPYYIPTGTMPSFQQLEELKEHIKVQTEEKKRRTLIFSTLRAEIRSCLSEMGRQPLSALEQDAIYGDEENISLISENIKALQFLKEHLEQKKGSLLSSLNELKEKVQLLWDRLLVPEEEKAACLKTPTFPLSFSTAKWEKELYHLQELQKRNIKDIILKIREELVVYWNKCFYSTEKRNAFTAYYSEDYSEELLSQHDEEVVRLKQEHEKCKEMLEGVNKWESNFEQFLVLEKKASDPNRFSNRGGSLLKEEKERVKLQKLLSKLEEEVKSRIEAWEVEQPGFQLLLKGRTFVEYVAFQWDQQRLLKEQEKQERNVKKEDLVTFKTPMKRPAISCTQGTPLNKTRKLNGASTSSNAKTTVPAKTPLPTIKTPSTARETPLRTPLHDSNKQTGVFSIHPGTYSEFKEAIAKKSSKDAFFNSTVNEHL